MNVCPVLVGRSAELAELRAACAAGGGLVLVSGEAGIGKTRLLREFADSLRADRRPVAWARPEAVARSGPYALVADLLDEIAVMLGKAGEEARTLAGVLGVGSSSEPAARPIAARVRGMLGQLGPGLVLMLEDIHLTDELSQAVIAHLARSARDDDLLIVATYRAEDEATEGMARLLDLLTRDRIAVHVRLQPLDRDCVAEMVGAMWGAPPSAEELDAMERLGEGIPFFVEELAAARESGGKTIPETIARAVLTRLQQLSEDARRVVRVAALTEGSIDPGVVADAACVEESQVPSLLLEAIRVGLLSDQQGRLAFRHALVRAAIGDSIISIERQGIHRKLAVAIEVRHVNSVPIEALARHWREAGDNQRAAELFLEVGTRAIHAGALDEAHASYLLVQSIAPRRELAFDAVAGEAEVLIRIRDYEGAIRKFREAAESYASSGNLVAAASVLSRSAVVKSFTDGGQAVLLLDEALALLSGESEGLSYTRILAQKGNVLVQYFDSVDEGAKTLRQCLGRAKSLKDPRLLAVTHEGLAIAATTKGDPSEAALHGQQACIYADASGDSELIARANGHQATRLVLSGQSTRGLEHLQKAQDSVSQGMAAFYLQSLENIRTYVLWRLGRPAEAERVASALEATKWARDYAGAVRVWAAAQAGDSERVSTLLQSMWAEVGGSDRQQLWFKFPGEIPEGRAEGFAVLAELLSRIYGQDSDPALTVRLTNAMVKSSADVVGDPRLEDLHLHARALIAVGDFEEAEVATEEINSLIDGASYRSFEAVSLELRGLSERLRGRTAVARARFDEAARILEFCGNGSDRARCLRLTAEVARELGEDDHDVIERLREARRLAFEFGALVEMNKCESLMRGMGARPRAGRPRGPKRGPDELSPREQETVALVAAGATNAEIANRLFLSDRTVQDHISNAQRRLGVSGRAGLAAWAAKKGLV